ncbi:MAG: hypothetical protein OSB70_13775 [Myxococcota bacterium]|nr:hypothetical protein [Myxococcota bacterium]
MKPTFAVGWPFRHGSSREPRSPGGQASLQWLFVLMLSLSAPAAVSAEPSLNERVALWSAGHFRSPVHCEIGGQLIRGIRRVLIQAESVPGRDPLVQAEFFDFEPEDATRCIDATGGALPNVVGRLELRRERNQHPETAQRDFKRALKKDKGFSYKVISGTLDLQDIEDPPAPARPVDFAGGSLSLSLIFPATDAQRALVDFPSGRKILLTLESGNGQVIRMPLFDPAEVWQPPLR